MATWLLREDDFTLAEMMRRTSLITFRWPTVIHGESFPTPTISLDPIGMDETREFVRDGGRSIRQQFKNAVLMQFVPP